jgi:hypothetical protein
MSKKSFKKQGLSPAFLMSLLFFNHDAGFLKKNLATLKKRVILHPQIEKHSSLAQLVRASDC